MVFFIVTTSFVKETGVDINRPNAETAERDEKGNILVKVFKEQQKSEELLDILGYDKKPETYTIQNTDTELLLADV